MKKFMFGAAIAALIATPTLASADTNAIVCLHYNNIDPDGADNVDSWGLDGAFSSEMSNGWTIQADGSHDRTDLAGTNVGSSYGAINLGMRMGDHAIYGFVGLSDLLASSGTEIGIGGQFFWNEWTFDGSVGYADFDDALLPSANATNISVDGTYFFNDNLSVTGVLRHTEAEIGGGDTDWNTIGIGGEYRFAGSPVSIGLGFQQRDYEAGDANVWNVSLKYDLGTGSLRDRSHSGPSWNGAAALNEEAIALSF